MTRDPPLPYRPEDTNSATLEGGDEACGQGTSILTLVAAVTITTPLFAQTRAQGPWWPHPLWGPDDQAGGSNWITPEKILEAVTLVKTGKVYELGNVYERGMPMIGQRTFAMFIPAFPTYGPIGDTSIVFNDEFLCAEIGQVGTQFDGLGHVGKRFHHGGQDHHRCFLQRGARRRRCVTLTG